MADGKSSVVSGPSSVVKIEKPMLDAGWKRRWQMEIGFIELKTASGRWKDDSGWQNG